MAVDAERTTMESGVSRLKLVAAGRLTHHRATVDVASEPEDQQDNQQKTEQSAAVM
jgi:hypothetical protein